MHPWGVLTFPLRCLGQRRGKPRSGQGRSWEGGQRRPLGGQPDVPVIAGVSEEPLTTPEPTDPIGNRPLRSSLLSDGIRTEPLARCICRL
jgi:hypothetical protein